MLREYGQGTDMSDMVAEVLPNTMLGQSRYMVMVFIGDFYLFGYILVTWLRSFRLCVIIKASLISLGTLYQWRF